MLSDRMTSPWWTSTRTSKVVHDGRYSVSFHLGISLLTSTAICWAVSLSAATPWRPGTFRIRSQQWKHKALCSALASFGILGKTDACVTSTVLSGPVPNLVPNNESSTVRITQQLNDVSKSFSDLM